MVELDKFGYGFICGLVVIILLVVMIPIVDHYNNSKSTLINIVESTYCLENTTIANYAVDHISCCRMNSPDPLPQHYYKYNMSVDIVQCYNALASVGVR